MPNPMHTPRYGLLRSLLVELRERSRLTQTELANWLGRPQSYVSKYERGERRIDPVELIDIVDAPGIDKVDAFRRLLDKIQ